MYNKTIIRFGFCDMPNYHIDIDTSAYHKNLIQ